MSVRDHHVAGQAPDWRTAHPGHTPRRKLPKHVRKALRNYRRHVRPMAEEPHSLVDSWPFLVPGLLIAVGILLCRAWGWL